MSQVLTLLVITDQQLLGVLMEEDHCFASEGSSWCKIHYVKGHVSELNSAVLPVFLRFSLFNLDIRRK